jgi:MFS transporter, ACS family, glucarate transporter
MLGRRPALRDAGGEALSAPVSRVRWRILALLFCAGFMSYLLRTNMSIAGESMMTDLGLSQMQLGLVLAAFAWGYGLFQFPGGLFGDRIGARRSLTMMLVAWGILNILIAAVPKGSTATPTMILGSLIGLRFLMGMAQGPLFPVTSTTCNWFPVGGWALPNGLQNAGLTLGSAATGPIVAWLMERVGWRESFVLTAPPVFLIAAIWWWYARDFPADHSGVSPAELDLIDAGRPSQTETPEADRDAWKMVLKNRDVLLLTASYFCQNYVFYFFFNWLFIYLVESRGFRILEGGAYAAAPWLTGTVMAVLGGLACDVVTRRSGIRRGCRLTGAGAMVGAAVLIAAAASARGSIMAVILLSLCLGCQQFSDAAYWAATISVSGKHASTACGLLNTGGNVVGGIVALLVPVIVKSLGWGAALASGSLFALLAAVLWIGIRPDRLMGSATGGPP